MKEGISNEYKRRLNEFRPAQGFVCIVVTSKKRSFSLSEVRIVFKTLETTDLVKDGRNQTIESTRPSNILFE